MTNPSPIVPDVLHPQDHKVPSVLIADLLTVVETSAHQFVAEQNSCTGEQLATVVPFPNSDAHPQDHRVPSVLIADILRSPAETTHQFVAEQNSCTGEDTFTIFPFPSTPLGLLPQDQRVPLDLTADPLNLDNLTLIQFVDDVIS